MKRRVTLLSLAASLSAAIVTPAAAHDDPRVETIRYSDRQPFHIATTPGSDLTILLGAGERIGNVKLSDYARYQVTISQGRDSLVLHTSGVTYPGASNRDGSLLLSSNAHEYVFVLTSAPPRQPTAYVLRFTYRHADRAARNMTAGNIDQQQYKLTGNREVRPSSVTDDGAKTFIQWPTDAAIPAVFALEHGREEMVNGFVRAGVFTIDRVHQHLVFRIDKLQADALRRASGGSQ